MKIESERVGPLPAFLDPSKDAERHREADRVAPGWRGFAYPKPERRSTSKGRKDRAEDVVEQKVRAACVARDGDCRVSTWTPLSDKDEHRFTNSPCSGESEFAHLRGHKRSETRKMAPEQRHARSWCVQLCSKHHHLEDANILIVTPLSDKGADGNLRFEFRPHRIGERS